jgi:exodeoxyribonuclease-3
MRIVSFNVNGVRAIIKKDFPEDFKSLDADIFIIEESKFTEDEHAEFPFEPEGYDVYWTNSKLRKGYSGVAIFTRVKPLSVHYGMGDGEYDEEGRLITLEFENFFVIGCYTPNSGAELKRLDFRMEFEDKLKEYMVSLDKIKPVILTGDLNVAHSEIDLKNPSANHHNAGFTNEERAKFDDLLNSGFVDSFRELYPDKVQYSWWSYRFNARSRDAGWRIDYFVVSKRLMESIKNSVIRDDILGSDHCPVVLDI